MECLGDSRRGEGNGSCIWLGQQSSRRRGRSWFDAGAAMRWRQAAVLGGAAGGLFSSQTLVYQEFILYSPNEKQ